MLKPYTLKIEEKQLRILEALSKQTRIPKSALIRKGIELVVRETSEDVLTPELRHEIDQLLHEDRNLLNRLAQA
jgi:hypothetical protein